MTDYENKLAFAAFAAMHGGSHAQRYWDNYVESHGNWLGAAKAVIAEYHNLNAIPKSKFGICWRTMGSNYPEKCQGERCMAWRDGKCGLVK